MGAAMAETETQPQVTICPPGKRSKGIVERAPSSGVTTATTLKWPEPEKPIPSAKDNPRTVAERLVAVERARNYAFASAQPHRRDFESGESEWLESPLGRFCWSTWPGQDSATRKHRIACYAAGGDYSTEIRQAKLARGFHVDGLYPENPAPLVSDDLPDDPKKREAILAAAKTAIEAADAKVRRANEVLTGIMPRLPRAMESLCCTHVEPSPYDHGILQAGLWRLAGHYGLLDRGINALKEF